MAYGWQNSCQLRSCNYLQNVGATTYKKFLQFYAKKACKKQKQELPDDITVPEHKRKARRTHADLFKNVPSCDEIISLPEEERNCPTCGTQMECIGKEFVRHEFRFTPAKGKVVNIYRETYKCPECAISEEHPDDL